MASEMRSQKCRECGKEFLFGESECNWCAPAFADRNAQGYVCETCGSRIPDGRTCPFCAPHTAEDVEALATNAPSDTKEENFLLVSFMVIAVIAAMFALPFIVKKLGPRLTFITLLVVVSLSVALTLAMRAKTILRNRRMVTEISWLNNIGTEIRNHTLAASVVANFFYIAALLWFVMSATLAWYMFVEDPPLHAIRQYIPVFTVPLFIATLALRAFVRSYIKRHCA